MPEDFEWDDAKASLNERKHGVTFEEAATVFDDPNQVLKFDEEHSGLEDRWLVLGFSAKERLLLVVTIDRGERTRIISARKATTNEAKFYGENQSS